MLALSIKIYLVYLFILFYFYFLNYGSMITHLQKTWKIQNKVTYISTMTGLFIIVIKLNC